MGRLASTVYDLYSRGLPAVAWQAVGTANQRNSLATYDPASRVSGTRDATGSWATYGYDPASRLSQVFDLQGGIAQRAYDAAGQTLAARDQRGGWTAAAYNARGWATTATDALGNVSTMAYDPSGNLTAVTDPLNHTTTYLYDALNRKTVVIDALGQRSTATYDPAGNLATLTDPLGHVVSYAYDALNRRITETDAVGTALQRTLTIGYDSVSNVTTRTDALGHTLTYAFDSLNRPTAMTDALGHTTTTAYDPAGNATAVTDPLSKVTTYVYDALNRKIAVIDPLGHSTTTVLDATGQVVATMDLLRNVTQYAYNALHQPVVQVDARGFLTQTRRDAVGNTVAVIDPVGNATTYVFDLLNREVLRTDPAGALTTTAYDAASRRTSVIDRDNRQVTYAYDAADRQTGQTWLASPGGSVVNRVTFTYDAKGNQLTAADAQGTITSSYDALDRLQVRTDVYGLTLTYSYDLADRTTLLQDSKGGLTTSVFDNANRLTSRQLSVAAGTVRLDPGYNNRNEMTSLTRYSDVAGTTVVGTTVYGYDDAGKITAITNKSGTGATLSYYTYGYIGNWVSQEAWGSGGTIGTHTYGNDPTGQLTYADSTNYQFDANGNRTMVGYQTGVANRMTNDGVFTYTYDGEGNLTQKSKGSGLETWYYSYDHCNLLTSVRQTSNGTTNLLTLTYTYDALNHLVKQEKWQSGGSTVTTRFSYDGRNVWAELDGSNNVQVRYVWGEGTAQLFARIDTATEWVLTDHLGTVRDIVSAAGTTVLDHIEYGAFGNVVSDTNASYAGSLGYTGLRQDRDAGIAEAGARTLLVTTGRWLQEDPIQFQAGDPNLERYVGNNPTNKTDPSGLKVIGLDEEGNFIFGPGWTPEQIQQFLANQENGSLASSDWNGPPVGAPGDLEIYVPVWGPGRAGLDAYQKGQYGLYAWYSVVTAIDIVSLGSLGWGAKGVLQGGGRVIGGGGARAGAQQVVTQGTATVVAQAPIRLVPVIEGPWQQITIGATGVIGGRVVTGLQNSAGGGGGQGGGSARNAQDEYVDLSSAGRRRHILDGDATGGGHRPGTGIPGKSEFPAGWSDDKIMNAISDVATNPNSIFTPGRGGRTVVTGTVDGVTITVILESPARGGGIVTGFPTNVPRNP